ncbi:MAG: GNAT family N-acetyltransferase [Bacilli bacterium]|jgi:GNAT superfamily N-acetyltransferase|nr:GNAT family N-acetyltransferase [Bacilli bacterium]
METELTFRKAERKDADLLLSFIKKLSVYEKMEDQVSADRKTIEESFFKKKNAEAIFLMVEGKEIGFAVYFTNFSTFKGKGGLYVEDVFIDQAYRHHGYGKKTFIYLAQLAKERNCPRMEWTCLDWNTPSIAFYKSLGAKAMDEWTIYRLDEKAIKNLAETKLNK